MKLSSAFYCTLAVIFRAGDPLRRLQTESFFRLEEDRGMAAPSSWVPLRQEPRGYTAEASGGWLTGDRWLK